MRLRECRAMRVVFRGDQSDFRRRTEWYRNSTLLVRPCNVVCANAAIDGECHMIGRNVEVHAGTEYTKVEWSSLNTQNDHNVRIALMGNLFMRISPCARRLMLEINIETSLRSMLIARLRYSKADLAASCVIVYFTEFINTQTSCYISYKPLRPLRIKA